MLKVWFEVLYAHLLIEDGGEGGVLQDQQDTVFGLIQSARLIPFAA